MNGSSDAATPGALRNVEVSGGDETVAIEERLAALAAEKEVLESRLAERAARSLPGNARSRTPDTGQIDATSPPTAKIALFRSLFRGREDVYATRWTNAKTGRSGYAPSCANEWKPGLCGKPAISCGKCPNSAWRPVTDDAIARHLGGAVDGGDFTIGVYPLMPDETCRFLAADFDKDSWRQDAAAFLAACRADSVPASLERSRSGNGGHVWIFFAEPVPAPLARHLGARLLTGAMARNPDMGFDSYDRLFPSQDTLPAGGFGNLIALPLQHRPRWLGNSVFVDDDLLPYPDQWDYLSSVKRISLSQVCERAGETEWQAGPVECRLSLDTAQEEPWLIPPSRRALELPVTGPLPRTVEMVLADHIYIDRAGLPPALVNRLMRLAAFRNPAFYSAQAMRLSTFGLPRIVACAEVHPRHVALPRGCREDVHALLSALGIDVRLRDERNAGRAIEAAFLGELSPEQQAAADALLAHDTGVLAAATAFGKTVVAAAMIAERKANTLVLVHRRQLLDQWIARLGVFLDLPPDTIGRIGGGQRKPGGVVDVAVIQSLVRNGEVDDIVADYGHLVVDECHHVAAVSFEAVARRCPARHVLGLSATLTRRDGHHPIIFMQCGPVRFRAGDRQQAASRPFGHRVVLRRTGFVPSPAGDDARPSIPRIHAVLAQDTSRNDLIFDDVLAALEAGRSPLLLSERKDHAVFLAERFARFARNVILLHGGMGVRQRRDAMERLDGITDGEERLLVATGRYIGEGFDDARLDTLFLTLPIAWRGTLAQYVGRLHRRHPGKREVLVYDYVDAAVPTLARMAKKRVRGYESLGYTVGGKV